MNQASNSTSEKCSWTNRLPCRSESPLPIPGWSRFLCLLVLLFLVPGLAAQTKSELEQKKEALQNKIRETEELIRKKEASRKATLNDYVALQNQLANRRQLIATIRQSMQHLDKSIRLLKDSIEQEEQKILELKEEYGHLLQAAYRLEQTGHPLLYLMSSESLNQAFARWRYLKQFHDYRQSQMEQIKSHQMELTQKYKTLDSVRSEKDSLLAEELENSRALNQSLEQKNRMLQSLKSDEASLKRQLREQERNKRELDRAISKIIREETASRDTDAPESTLPTTPEYKALTGAFEENRGKLPWPVQRGIVVRRFGKQNHPTLPGVTVTNNGIDITTDTDAPVRALFNGTVAGKVFVPGYQNMLIIQHGEYYSVYSRLKRVDVRKGEEVRTGQQIGLVSTLAEDQQTSQVHLEIWKGKSKLDPISWLIPR